MSAAVVAASRWSTQTASAPPEPSETSEPCRPSAPAYQPYRLGPKSDGLEHTQMPFVGQRARPPPVTRCANTWSCVLSRESAHATIAPPAPSLTIPGAAWAIVVAQIGSPQVPHPGASAPLEVKWLTPT